MANPSENLKKTLRDQLLDRTVVAPRDLWRPEGQGGVRCVACAHRCFVPEGRDGICKVRSNRQGELRVPWGYVGGTALDPIEKKPFFHVFPGQNAFSFGMLGCDLHCSYCQNWITSQALRDPDALALPLDVSAKELAETARRGGARLVTSTYNEPLITAEWGVEVFRATKQLGIPGSFVSNGNATPEVLAYLRPWVDFYKIDLKSFRDKRYRELGGVLENVKRAIVEAHRLGFWLEIVTLLVPGFNDDPGELKELAEFIASVSRDIPWHVTGYHQDYHMRDHEATPVASLVRAGELGKSAGLHFVYLGNRSGQVNEWENTYCPGCGETLVRRRGFRLLENKMTTPRCPGCDKKVPGHWV